MDAVVVTHDSAGDLRALVASPVTVSAFDRLVVVDNASTDDTVAIAAQAGFHVLVQASNRGLASAVNLGVRATGSAAFALLNPDVRFSDPGDLPRLVKHLDDATVGAVAPALMLPDGRIQDSARRVPTPMDLVTRRFTGRTPDAVRAEEPVDVDWAVAACLIVRRAAFDRIGGLDERFFLYFEDVDFGVRLRAAGHRIRYDPTVQIFHDHRAASRSNLTSLATRQHIRSAARFYLRHPKHLRSQKGR